MSYEILLESKIEKITNDIQLDKEKLSLKNKKLLLEKHRKIYHTMLKDIESLDIIIKTDLDNQDRNITFKFIRNVKTIFRTHLNKMLDTFDYNDGNYIATHLEMIDGVQYLVNEEGLVFSYNIESPIFIGQKTDEGTIKKIDGNTLTPTAITAH